MSEDQFVTGVLAQRVQSMIYMFKRTISCKCEKFLTWFVNELKINPRFHEIYIGIASDGFDYLIRQWSLSGNQYSQKSQADI